MAKSIQEALEALNQALEHAPEELRWPILLRKGIAVNQLEEYQEASEALNQASEKAPEEGD